MKRPGWATAAAIYNWIAGGFGVLQGLAILVMAAVAMDMLAGMFRALGAQGGGAAMAPLLALGLLVILFSMLQIVYAVGLWKLRRWGWVMAVVTHLVLALLQLVALIILIANGLAGLAILQTFFMGINILFAVGLLLRSTAAAYAPGAAHYQAAAGPGFEASARLAFGGAPPSGARFDAGIAAGAGGPLIGPTAAAPPLPAARHDIAPRFGVAKTELASPEPSVLAWLVERTGTRVGREHRLKQQVTIGRDPARCEIVLDDTKVSGEHARIRLEDGQFVLYDLASLNHTYVNEQEIHKQALRDGDQIRIGPDTMLSFMHIAR